MPAVAIETVIIIIVVVSFAVLAGVIFALYFLWHLLLEDRRCSRNFEREWQRQSLGPLLDGPQRTLLVTSRNGRAPRISRRREMFVDERSRRMVKAARCSTDIPVVDATSISRGQCTERNSVVNSVVVAAVTEEIRPPDMLVLDGTEPPPPYEESTRR
ncbi:hypothetical protein JTE90_007135 [Oedothorax gibbosus]|uniref:Uncharacterized protein n=1 Tax=Oedothorax gibbosus TaxID=931172 RepID=A0AAV6VRX9_9ARAC|nr:hypothetical protein JTE90_007135 [Oedothorax gibbosus]